MTTGPHSISGSARTELAQAQTPADQGTPPKRPWVSRILILVLLVLLAALGLVVALYFFPMRKQLADTESALAEEERTTTDLTARLAALDVELAALRAQANGMLTELTALRDLHAEAEAELDALRQAKEALEQQLQAEIASGDIAVTGEGNDLTVNVADRVLFPSGSAQLSPAGQAVLRRVADTLRGLEGQVIEITGHTDSAPLSRSLQERFATNWELSTARATNVVRFLQDECQVPGERLVAMGRASYDPVANNRTPRGRQRNRRIELTLAPLPEAPPDEAARAATPTPE